MDKHIFADASFFRDSLRQICQNKPAWFVPVLTSLKNWMLSFPFGKKYKSVPVAYAIYDLFDRERMIFSICKWIYSCHCC